MVRLKTLLIIICTVDRRSGMPLNIPTEDKTLFLKIKKTTFSALVSTTVDRGLFILFSRAKPLLGEVLVQSRRVVVDYRYK